MKKIYYLLFIVLLGFASACTDEFEDMNTDKKNPAEVAGNTLFSNAQKDLADQVNRPNVNWNNHKLWAQYWTETTYTDEANFDIVNRNVPQAAFRAYYRRILKDLNEASNLIMEEEVVPNLEVAKQNRLYIIELLNVYAWQRLVDLFGMVPYTEALNAENVYPVYDDGAAIYTDLFARLNAALSGLDASEGSFGGADYFYSGDVASWIKFGNTLKVKMAINLADVNSATAQTHIEAAVAAGCFESDADDCLMPYGTSAPNFNQIYGDLVASGRDDYVPANTIVDYMNGLNDPRRDNYFTTYGGAYVGGTYGESSPYAQYSHVASGILAADFPGFILTYNELQFYLAEAAARGYNVGGTAESFYNEGITNSILWWDGDAAEATAYLAQPEVDYATAVAASNWREVIGLQSWIASYLKGFIGWTTWRRLDAPTFNPPPSVTDESEIPTRYTFPINEQTLNEVNYAAAAAAIGGDELTTKIFWDIY